MRGGAIPLLAWGTLLLVLYAVNWVWEGRPVQAAETAFAILVIYGAAAGLWLARREAVRRGPPPVIREPEALPEASLGAVLVGLSVGCALFGVVWARFLLYFGIAMFVVAVGRVVLELQAQARSRAQAAGEGEPASVPGRPERHG